MNRLLRTVRKSAFLDYALFLLRKKACKGDFLWGERVFEVKIEDFLLQKHAHPNRFFQRTPFSRSEEQYVNRVKSNLYSNITEGS